MYPIIRYSNFADTTFYMCGVGGNFYKLVQVQRLTLATTINTFSFCHNVRVFKITDIDETELATMTVVKLTNDYQSNFNKAVVLKISWAN